MKKRTGGPRSRGDPRHPPPFAEFAREAERLFHRIPLEYRSGVEGLQVQPEALPHPRLAAVFTLGECRVVDWTVPAEGTAELRSEVVLYHGSFRRLADLDPEFDWRGELWETITHEVQHHLEFRANVRTLEERDYADDQNFRRAAGEAFDPLFYRFGERVDEGVYRVGDDWFVEAERSDESMVTEPRFEWRGRRYRLRVGGPSARVVYVRAQGLEVGPGELWVVARQTGGWWSWLRALSGRGPRPLRLVAHAVSAEALDDDG